MRPTVCCYNLKGTDKGKEIANIFGYLGFRVRAVNPADYAEPLSDVAAGKVKDHEPYEGEGFTDEMLLICESDDQTLDQALYLMKQEQISVDLKAVLTENNQNWTSLQLHEEISTEHNYLHRQESTDKEEN